MIQTTIKNYYSALITIILLLLGIISFDTQNIGKAFGFRLGIGVSLSKQSLSLLYSSSISSTSHIEYKDNNFKLDNAIETTTTRTRVTCANHDIHLLSLNWSTDDKFCKPVRDIWKWKDSALGDGRDFFVPKPKTIKALQEYIVNQCSCVQECTVLSNCARLKVICVVDPNKTIIDDENTINELLLKQVSYCILAQTYCNSKEQKQQQPLLFASKMLRQHLDLPDVSINMNAKLVSSNTLRHDENDLVDLVANNFWTHIQGIQQICHHLCLVAAGIALRPRRPDRIVIFRPFSSRDAHVLLQLKRTQEVAQQQKYDKERTSINMINLVLQYALRAGKAVRTIDKVPELKLLKEYGSGDSKYSSEPPIQLSQQVSKAAIERVIDPLVQECQKDVNARLQKSKITQLRTNAESLAQTYDELILIRQRLHKPTMSLRGGKFTSSDANKFLLALERELVKSRGHENN